MHIPIYIYIIILIPVLDLEAVLWPLFFDLELERPRGLPGLEERKARGCSYRASECRHHQWITLRSARMRG